MTVAELATATRLSEKNISLIEAGDWKAFPVQAYLRGYLNSVCVKLGLDSKRVLDWYSAETGAKFASLLSDKPQASGGYSASSYDDGEKSGGGSKGKVIVIILVVIGLALVVASKFFKEATPTQGTQEVSKTELVEEEAPVESTEMPEGAEAVPVDSANVDTVAKTAAPEPPANVGEKDQRISQAVVDEAIKKSDRPASATIFLSSDSKKDSSATTKSFTRIQLEASGEKLSWIGIKHREDDATFLKEANLSVAGTQMVYESTDTLYVVVGESRAISKLILNGVETPLPGVKFGRVTRFSVYGGKIISGRN
jgi:cytoskeletal protein RodZ